MKFDYMFESIKDNCLVLDLETCSEDFDGNDININSQLDYYIEMAEIRWAGFYSFKHNKLYLLEYKTQKAEIKQLLSEHSILIGFNCDEFDVPILKMNNCLDETIKYNIVDCMQILGSNTFKNKSGWAFKNRGSLMKYDFAKNSLKHMAQVMKLDVQKGDIDYKIFKKSSYTPEEVTEIKSYLLSDVMANKAMFDKLWDFWLPFTDLLNQEFVLNLSWIKNSIASLTYKAACTLMGVEATYGDKVSEKEKMGGRVIMPKYEEAKGVWYVDWSSLYPHIMCMFNLFAENVSEVPNETPYGWHGNDVFKVRGYYHDNEPHILNKQVQAKLKEKTYLQKNDPDNPMIRALKNFLTALYGVSRSSIFEKVHTPNCGWDTCYLGQQINTLTEMMMSEFGFKTIYGDTDSNFLLPKEEKYNNREYVLECLKKVIKKINDNCLFPVDTFDIKIENYLDYVMYPFSYQELVDKETRKLLKDEMITGFKEELIDNKKCIIDEQTGKVVKRGRSWVKERMGKKKNYLYLVEDKITLIGLPIKKSNATALGIKIFEEVLEPLITKNRNAKFSKEFIDTTVEEYLKKPGIMQLISQEHKVKPADTYKKESQIQGQISRAYFDGRDGIINLIKNSKVGKCGKGNLYCSVQEAIDNNLTIKDIDMEKLWNEIDPFIKYKVPVIRKVRAEAKSNKVSRIKEDLKVPEFKEEFGEKEIDGTATDCYYEEQ